MSEQVAEDLQMMRTRRVLRESDIAQWQAVSSFITSTMQTAIDIQRIVDWHRYGGELTEHHRAVAEHLMKDIEKQCKQLLGTTLIHKP